MKREKIWEATSYAWTEIGLEPSDFVDFARDAGLTPQDRKALAHAVFWETCGAFAIETVFALLLMGITLPDWQFPEPVQKVQRWLCSPLALSLLNPLWLLGYPLACVFALGYWRKLRRAANTLHAAAPVQPSFPLPHD